jgi:alkylation response protein AidB-like acyl-CoA dehydrogenase
MVDVITLTEALGQALVTEPFVASLILGGRLVELLGDEEQKQRVIPLLISGDLQLALAHTERGAGGDPACVGCEAFRDGDDYLLSGDKLMVLNGPSADKLLVTARSSGGERHRQGIEVFLVDAAGSGISKRCYRTLDGLRAADIHFDQVRLPAAARLGDPASNIAAIESVIDGFCYAEAFTVFGLSSGCSEGKTCKISA